MHNYEHKKLIGAITKLGEVPADTQAYSKWIQAEAHLEFLRENARTDELIIYGVGDYTFVYAVVVPNAKLSPIDRDDLMGWNLSPRPSIASYTRGGGRDDVWVGRGLGTEALEGAVQLIFARTFQGWTEKGRDYYELYQEYAHLADIHWRPEKRAYSRFNGHGDLEPVVSITTHEDKGSNLALVSFKWEPLEEYLVTSNASLVRVFDFNLFRRSEFSGWSDEPPREFYDSDHFFYRRKVMPGYAARTLGVQIIRPRRPEKAVFTGMTDGWSGQKTKSMPSSLPMTGATIALRKSRPTRAPRQTISTRRATHCLSSYLPLSSNPKFLRSTRQTD